MSATWSSAIGHNRPVWPLCFSTSGRLVETAASAAADYCGASALRTSYLSTPRAAHGPVVQHNTTLLSSWPDTTTFVGDWKPSRCGVEPARHVRRRPNVRRWNYIHIRLSITRKPWRFELFSCPSEVYLSHVRDAWLEKCINRTNLFLSWEAVSSKLDCISNMGRPTRRSSNVEQWWTVKKPGNQRSSRVGPDVRKI